MFAVSRVAQLQVSSWLVWNRRQGRRPLCRGSVCRVRVLATADSVQPGSLRRRPLSLHRDVISAALKPKGHHPGRALGTGTLDPIFCREQVIWWGRHLFPSPWEVVRGQADSHPHSPAQDMVRGQADSHHHSLSAGHALKPSRGLHVGYWNVASQLHIGHVPCYLLPHI